MLYAALILIKSTKVECAYALKVLALPGAIHFSEIALAGFRVHACKSASPFTHAAVIVPEFGGIFIPSIVQPGT